MEFMAGVTVWTGSAKDLLGALDLRVGDNGMKRRGVAEDAESPVRRPDQAGAVISASWPRGEED